MNDAVVERPARYFSGWVVLPIVVASAAWVAWLVVAPAAGPGGQVSALGVVLIPLVLLHPEVPVSGAWDLRSMRVAEDHMQPNLLAHHPEGDGLVTVLYVEPELVRPLLRRIGECSRGRTRTVRTTEVHSDFRARRLQLA